MFLSDKYIFSEKFEIFSHIIINVSEQWDLIFTQLVNEPGRIEVLPNTEERYISIIKHVSDGMQLRFLDSFRFMSSALAKLAENLPRDKFHHTERHVEAEILPLMLRKGIFRTNIVTLGIG